MGIVPGTMMMIMFIRTDFESSVLANFRLIRKFYEIIAFGRDAMDPSDQTKDERN